MQYYGRILWNIIYFIHYKQLRMPFVLFYIADQIEDHRSLIDLSEINLA